MKYGEDVTVLNRSKTLTVSGYQVVSKFTRPLSGLVLGLGIIFSSTPYLSVQAAEQMASSSSMSSNETPRLAARSLNDSADLGQLSSEAVAATETSFPANGVYLYGQSPEPEQVGSAYAVMEIVENRAVGAFYMPQSSFDCFYTVSKVLGPTLAIVRLVYVFTYLCGPLV